MRWILARLPLLLSGAVTIYVMVAFEISRDPKLPVVDSWLEIKDQRLVAEFLLLALTFVLVYVVLTIIWRSLLQAAPSRLKGPLGFEMDWAPEDAKSLREVDEKQQESINDLTTLTRDLARKLKGSGR
jgi:hypothetical protein